MYWKLLLLSLNMALLLYGCHGDSVPSGIPQNFKIFKGAISKKHPAMHSFTANITSLINKVWKLIKNN